MRQHVVSRLKGYPDTAVFVFSRPDRKAIHEGHKKIIFKFPQVMGEGVTFSNLQFGEMTVQQALDLTTERPVGIEVLTQESIVGKSVQVF